MSTPDSDCLFCKIVSGDIPGEIVHTSDTTVAFRDVNPQAPLHVLVVPKTHLANAAEVAEAEPQTLSAMVSVAKEVAASEGHTEYRMVFNTGEGAGQSVFHAHLHVLAGRALSWPPG